MLKEREGREGDVNVFSDASTFLAQVIFLSAGDDRAPQGQPTPRFSIVPPLTYSLPHTLSSPRHSLDLVTQFSKTFTSLVIFVNPKFEIAQMLCKIKRCAVGHISPSVHLWNINDLIFFSKSIGF